MSETSIPTISGRIIKNAIPTILTRFLDISSVLFPTTVFALYGEREAAAAQFMDISLVAIVCLRQYAFALNVYLPNAHDTKDLQGYYAAVTRYANKAGLTGSIVFYILSCAIFPYTTNDQDVRDSVRYFAAFAGLAPLYLLHTRNDQQFLFSRGKNFIPVMASTLSFITVILCTLGFTQLNLEGKALASAMGFAYLLGAIIKSIFHKIYLIKNNPLQLPFSDTRSSWQEMLTLIRYGNINSPSHANNLFRIGKFIVLQVALETFLPPIQTLFVTHLGTRSLAKLKLVSTLLTIVIVTCMGFGNGAGIEINKTLGKQVNAESRTEAVDGTSEHGVSRLFARIILFIFYPFSSLIYTFLPASYQYHDDIDDASRLPAATINFTEEQYRLAKKSVWIATAIVTIFASAIASIAIINPRIYLNLLSRDEALIEATQSEMRITGFWIIFSVLGTGLALGMRVLSENRSAVNLRLTWDWVINLTVIGCLVYKTSTELNGVLTSNAATSLLLFAHLTYQFSKYTREKALANFNRSASLDSDDASSEMEMGALGSADVEDRSSSSSSSLTNS